VIFEEAHTRKFVQFAHKSQQGLLLDLRGMALDAAEMERAMRFFQERGIRAKESVCVAAPDGKTGGREKIFHAAFGQDVAVAAEAALAVLEQVYHLPADCELMVGGD
jgi:hypothetical protein